jgi:2-deoxy-D-gluconate 3-dehydrogenase
VSVPALFDLSGQVALVTGGNRGIGRGIALGLAGAGADVAILGRDEERLERVRAEIEVLGVRSLAVRADLTDRAALGPAFACVERELGPVGILVNNAGIARVSRGVLEESAESWDDVLATQLHAVFLLSKLAAASMRDANRGKIINIGSIYSYFGSKVVPSYGAAKGAVMQLTRSMAIELAPYNIQVNLIAPGWIETDMTEDVRLSSSWNDEILMRTPAGRWGQPEDLAGTAVYLASRASNFVTGAAIFVDGGYAIR